MTIVLLTGQAGAGKTAVCQRVVDLARQRGYLCGGLLTPAVLDREGVKVGIEALDPLSGERWPLARTDQDLDGPQVGSYHLSATALKRCLAAIERAAEQCDLLVIDEIGPLELERGEGLVPALDILLGRRALRALVVVRHALLDELCERLSEAEPLVFTVNDETREALPERIVKHLLGV
ncbi:MAG: nucleoside-triphosphatase [Anaerolineae bacterium]